MKPSFEAKPSLVAAFFVLFLLSFSAFAQVRLPQIISDGLVLQREQNIKIWGWSSANEEISLNFKDNKYQTVADDAGNWEIMLPPQLAGGPYDLTLRGGEMKSL